VKALSLRQPWAYAVVHLGKHIENRHWNTSHRGDFLIHASKGMTKAEYEDAADFIRSVRSPEERSALPLPPYGAFKDPERYGVAGTERGGIVGRARVVRVLPPCPEKCFHRLIDGPERCGLNHPPWHMPEQCGFVLSHVKAIPFIACKGELQFFQVPPEVEDEIMVRSFEGMAEAIGEDRP
jgi:hypothetical protein